MGCSASQARVVKSIGKVKKGSLRVRPGQFIVFNDKVFTEVYSVGRSLGTGTFGEVKFCTHIGTKAHRAVKIFKKDELLSEFSKKKFEKEIEILKSLDHPNIIRIFEYFEDSHKFYIVMEHCRGGELFTDLIKLKSYSEPDSAQIMRQIFSALSYMHSQNIAHRDLKPENILFDEKSQFASIKLIDFGSAFHFSKKPMKEGIGTPYYISPEVIAGSYTCKCDMWSAGVILFILLIGSPPFTGECNKDIYASITKGKYNESALEAKNLSEDVKDLLKHLLVPEALRYTASQALDHPWIKKTAQPRLDLQALTSTFNNLSASEPNNLLRTAIKTFIVTQVLSIDHIKQLSEVFKGLDENGDGMLSEEELINGYMKVMSAEEAQERLEKLQKWSGLGTKGFITYTEFIQGAIEKEKMFTKANLKRAFEMFDKDASGGISADELRHVLSQNEHIDGKVWEQMVTQIDSNGNGVIDLAEFEALCLDN